MVDHGKKHKGYFFFFYWDPEDKRIFVPKRYGYGWTINLANPLSILVLFLTVLIVFVLVRLLSL